MIKSILVVDDEIPISFALTQMLGAQGYRIRVAENGLDAIDLASRHQPDLILLDTSLPDRDGYDVCQTLRSRPEMTHVKILMMSAHSRAIEKEKGLAMGADAYVTKPFSLNSLSQLIHDMIGAPMKNSAIA